MYGSLGPAGPEGPHASGSVSGEYGIPIFGVAVAWPLIYGTAAATTAALAVGGAVASNMAANEAARHTGGVITLPSGETVTADEAHTRLCASLPDDHYHKVPDKNGVVFCDRTPSQEALYHADTPQGVIETLQETFAGYDYRKQASGDCDAVGSDGQPLDPRCNRNPESPIKPWMVLSVVGLLAAAIIFSPAKKA